MRLKYPAWDSVAARTRTAKYAKRLVVSIIVLTIGFVVITPFIWMFSISMREVGDAYKIPPTLFPERIDFSNYQAVLESSINFSNLLKNTTVTTLLIIAVQLITVPSAGYSFARLHYKGRQALFIGFLISMMIPQQSIIIALYTLLVKTGLRNTLLSICVSCFFNAFGVFLFRQSFITIPKDFEDAAKIDGAGYFRTFAQIMLPMVKATTLTLIITTFNFAWSNYFHPLVFLTDWDKMTLSIGLVKLTGYMGSGSMCEVMAGAVMAIVPVMIVFFCANKYIITGLNAGGIKE